MDEKPDYTIDEILDEVLADESWEPDPEARMGAIMSFRFGFIM
jgi:hypothetical protein